MLQMLRKRGLSPQAGGALGREHPCPFCLQSHPEVSPWQEDEGRVTSLSPRRVALSLLLQGGFACQTHLFPRPVAMETGWLETGRGRREKESRQEK